MSKSELQREKFKVHCFILIFSRAVSRWFLYAMTVRSPDWQNPDCAESLVCRIHGRLTE